MYILVQTKKKRIAELSDSNIIDISHIKKVIAEYSNIYYIIGILIQNMKYEMRTYNVMCILYYIYYYGYYYKVN